MTLPRVSPDRHGRRVLSRAWERFCAEPTTFEGSGQAELVRPEIVASWRRSMVGGVDHQEQALPHREDGDPAGRLLRAARPILEHLVHELSESRTCVHLTDPAGWIVGRAVGDVELATELEGYGVVPGALLSEDVAGTNGLGSVLETRHPLVVAGPEHFREDYHGYTCAGVPIRNPFSRRIEGILDITCRFADTNAMLLPFVAEKARAIAELLEDGSAVRDQALFELFRHTGRRSGRATVCFNDVMWLANAPAAEILDAEDRQLLVAHASLVGDAGETDLEFSGGRRARVRFAAAGGDAGPAGTVATIRLLPTAATPPTHSPAGPRTGAALATERLERALTARRPVLVVGEASSGKMHAVMAGLARIGDDPPVVLDCRAARGGWFRLLTSTLAAGTTVVLRHLDRIPAAAADRLAAAVECDRAALVIATGAGDDVEADGVRRLHSAFDVRIEIPPLRARPDELPQLARRLVAELGAGRDGPAPRISSAAMRRLMAHTWPGNVAELRQALSTAMLTARHEIAASDLPRSVRPRGRAVGGLELAERDEIAATLRDTGWNRVRAAAALGISRSTLYRKIYEYGLSEPAV